MTYYFLFVVFGMAIAYLITAIKEKKVKQWWIATGVLAVAALLATGANLPSLYNTYEYSKETMRGGHSELPYPLWLLSSSSQVGLRPPHLDPSASCPF